jgi:hypothetical protein
MLAMALSLVVSLVLAVDPVIVIFQVLGRVDELTQV